MVYRFSASGEGGVFKASGVLKNCKRLLSQQTFKHVIGGADEAASFLNVVVC